MIQPSELLALQSSHLNGDDLHNAFETFNQLSKQLTESYQLLETRVTGLNSELAAARNERIKELTEKERLAKRLALLIDALPGGVVVLDGQGVVQECNPIAIDLLGEPLVGQKWLEIIERAFAPDGDHGHDITLTDGRSVNLSTCPLGDEPGQILLLTDVTEMRHLQGKLNHQQRLATMGETAASLAHQIRTPLSSVMLYTSSLKRPQMSDEARISLSEKIFSRLRHLEQLISNMLLYARGVTLNEDKINVLDLVNDLHTSIDAHLEEKQIDFLIDTSSETIFITGNYQMLLSAFMNLCVNAIQAMGQKGQIKISFSMSNDSKSVLIHVIDKGPGISKENQQAIFEPFITSKQDGTGLGLAVVKAVIKAHQGSIRLESDSGQGCDFCVALPVITNK